MVIKRERISFPYRNKTTSQPCKVAQLTLLPLSLSYPAFREVFDLIYLHHQTGAKGYEKQASKGLFMGPWLTKATEGKKTHAEHMAEQNSE